MLLGVSIVVSPLKEGSPAKIILNTTDALIQERRKRSMPVISVAWLKTFCAWVVVHLCAIVVAVAAWWKVWRS